MREEELLPFIKKAREGDPQSTMFVAAELQRHGRLHDLFELVRGGVDVILQSHLPQFFSQEGDVRFTSLESIFGNDIPYYLLMQDRRPVYFDVRGSNFDCYKRLPIPADLTPLLRSIALDSPVQIEDVQVSHDQSYSDIFPSLRSLKFDKNKCVFSARFVDTLTEFSHLQVLDLSSVAIKSSSLISRLAKLRGLITLALRWDRRFDFHDLVGFSSLEELELSVYPTAEILSSIARLLPNLKRLRLLDHIHSLRSDLYLRSDKGDFMRETKESE